MHLLFAHRLLEAGVAVDLWLYLYGAGDRLPRWHRTGDFPDFTLKRGEHEYNFVSLK